MKIIVPVKRVPDPDTRFRLNSDQISIDESDVKFVVNPFDAIALEEAVRIKERSPTVEIVAVSIGGDKAQEQLRIALAMGADRALLLTTEEVLDTLSIAKILAGVYRREKPDLVLMGKQAIDDDSAQVGPMLAGLIGVTQATFVSKLEQSHDAEHLLCSRETDYGIETIETGMPAVVTVDLRLNEPRYVSLPGIMKAKKKPLEVLSTRELDVKYAVKTSITNITSPPPRQPGVKLKTVSELIQVLNVFGTIRK